MEIFFKLIGLACVLSLFGLLGGLFMMNSDSDNEELWKKVINRSGATFFVTLILLILGLIWLI